MAGIQRVLSWLYTKQLKIAYPARRTFDQMKQLRFSPSNTGKDGEKNEKEKVFKLKDELPDCVRYGLMTWPSLPKIPDAVLMRDTRGMDEKTKWELEKIRTYANRDNERDLEPANDEYPTGNFYGVSEDAIGNDGHFYG